MAGVVLIHGKDGSPSTGWLPWLKEEVERQGATCIIPAFPPEDDSKLADWFKVLDGLQFNLEEASFVAHARGAMALLRWVNQLPAATSIPKIVLVSANFDYQPGRTDGDEFYSAPLDADDLRQKCKNFVVIHSADDPYVPITAGEQLAHKLGAKFVRYEGAGHFGSNKLEAPEIIQELIG